MRFKRFPPPRGHLLVPVTSRGAALAGLDLYPACRPRAVALHRVLRRIVATLGPRALPGFARAWRPSMDEETWEALVSVWRRELGEWDAIAVMERSQPELRGLSLLLIEDGDPFAFLKLRADEEDLAAERRALELVEAFGPTAFRSPRALASGQVGGWSWLAASAVPIRSSGPPTDPDLDAILPEVREALREFPKPLGTPTSWRPMHGDFTPWNLREARDGDLFLMDWESAGWAPPQADRVLWLATLSAVRGDVDPVGAPAEAIAFWRKAVAAREGTKRDGRLSAGIERALSKMERVADPEAR